MWPIRRKPKQPVLLAESDSGRRELLASQLQDMQSYGWDGSAHDAAEFLASLPAANDASSVTDRISRKTAPASDVPPSA